MGAKTFISFLKKLEFIEHPRAVLLHAWSSRIQIALFAVSAIDASYAYFLGYAPVQPWAMGLITCGMTALGCLSRVVLQRKLATIIAKSSTSEVPNADQ